MNDLKAKILSNRKLAENVYEMKFGCRNHGVSKSGQFINIKLDGFFLRRPISVCSWDEETVTVIYKTVGGGTEAMSHYEEGRSLDILTPLGNGYDISECPEENVIVTGGGAGVPPMYGLCREMIKNGIKPHVILGFNTAPEVFYEDEFRALGADLTIATADGSFGVKGFVTDVIKDMKCSAFFACGPEPMLKALDDTVDQEAAGQLSFEERMGCGFGACMGCSCKTKYGSKRICKDGPVLERSEIVW